MILGNFDIIVKAENADLTKHDYLKINGGNSGCTINVNNEQITVATGSSLDIKIKTVSQGVGCYLIGWNKNVINGSGEFANGSSVPDGYFVLGYIDNNYFS